MNNYFKIYCMLRAVEICCEYVMRRFNKKILPRDFKVSCLELSSENLFEYGPVTDDITHWACCRVYGALEHLKVSETIKSYEGHEEDRESVIRGFKRIQNDLMEWGKTVNLATEIMEVNDHE